MAMAPTVEYAVKESIEKSYGSATSSQPVQSTISPAVIQRIVKDFTEEEERSRNLIIFGLEDQENDNVEARVGDIFGAVGEKKCYRLGRRRLTIAQRVEHRRLVTQMKERAAEDKSQRFFITYLLTYNTYGCSTKKWFV